MAIPTNLRPIEIICKIYLIIISGAVNIVIYRSNNTSAMDSYWNDDVSYLPSIVINSQNNALVVWCDYTQGNWTYDSLDSEIFCVNLISGGICSNISVISDQINGSFWNIGQSIYPDIAIDSLDRILIVWEEHTNGTWGTDCEIFYVNFTSLVDVNNITIISDDQINWNDDRSYNPKIAFDPLNYFHIV